MNHLQLQNILAQIRRLTVGIIGDFCLDAYWFIDESRREPSLETGIPTTPIATQRYSLGGAGNVASNLVAMGVGNVRAFGIIGNDPFGVEMLKIMEQTGSIQTHGMVVQDNQWSTNVYIKPYLNTNEQSRIDFGCANRLDRSAADALLEHIEDAIGALDLVLINQQVTGTIDNQYLRNKLVDLIARNPTTMFLVDSRDFSDAFDGTYRKLNDLEAAALCGMRKNPGDTIHYFEVIEAASQLHRRWKKPMFITRGARGSIAVDDTGRCHEIQGLLTLSRTDTVGAGDAFLAGAASALAVGCDMTEAAELGNFAAGVTVQKLFQTGTASPAEILAIGRDPDYIYRPELAADVRGAHYYECTEIEIISSPAADIAVRHVIFDHDGTISTLRQGWEGIMEPMMLHAILGSRYGDADVTLLDKVRLRVRDCVDKTTGIQTLVQMTGLIDIIQEFGCVPQDKILDAFGYKRIYNNELMNIVREREEKLKSKELSIDDFTIKYAFLLLRHLYERGIRLYLASGTDEEDVKREARILGYDHFFDGRIFGAVGDITKEAKKLVLERIIQDIGPESERNIVTFGDGPVEIRETVKRGGFAIGVASDEVKRFGLNMKKRERLIRAGASVIVPDFSQLSSLLSLIGISL